MKPFHFRRVMVWKNLEMIFFYLSTAFPLFDYLFFGSAMEKSFYIFDKDLLFARNMVF